MLETISLYWKVKICLCLPNFVSSFLIQQFVVLFFDFSMLKNLVSSVNLITI